MKPFKTDLHIHTCLSPCADLDMSPKGIVAESLEKGLNIIAVCDHNSAENVGAVIKAGASEGLYVLPGMEINSKEEVHTIAIFESEEKAIAMQQILYDNLRGTNRPDIFGDQVVANELDEVEGFNDRLLIGAVQLSLEKIVRKVHDLGGLSIASHIDRPSYSIPSQLGFIPPDLDLDAIEIAKPGDKDFESRFLRETRAPILTASDAHYRRDIGRRYVSLILEFPGFGELQMALKSESGRKIGEIFS
ncbi:PHP domain-containing protein [Thermodesulfobacteriota bacterium]